MTEKPVALITGASEGLGKYLALECAQRGMHLVLVALPHSHLQQLAEYIGRQYGVQVWVFEKDLCAEESCTDLYNAIKAEGLTISVLINNAGMGGMFFFEQRSPEYYNLLIRLNVLVPTMLVRLFLADLKQAAPSFVLNVGSMAGFFHPPRKSVYGGTKSYLLGFSKSLRSELKRDGISVSVLCPGGMNTTWQLTVQNRTTSSWVSRQSVMFPCEVAGIAVAKMLVGKEVIVPGRWNRFFLVLNLIFPKRMKNFLTDYAMRKMTPAPQLTTPLEQEVPVVAVA